VSTKLTIKEKSLAEAGGVNKTTFFEAEVLRNGDEVHHQRILKII